MTEALKASRTRLLRALQEVESRPTCQSVRDLRLVDADKDPRWVFACDVKIDSADHLVVPPVTSWVFAVDVRYPNGGIEIYPALKGGITATFSHQDRNEAECPDKALRPYARAGDVCVREWTASLKRHGRTNDPLGNPLRLAWYFDRLVLWTQLASQNELSVSGDPFELPQFRASSKTVVGFVENENTFARWEQVKENYGRAELVALRDASAYAVRRFRTSQGADLVAPRWGALVAESQDSTWCPWFMLPQWPVHDIYATPTTWGEFAEILAGMDLQIRDVVRSVAPLVERAGPPLVLVGFRYPRLVGASASLVHWQPLAFPVTRDLKKVAGGFRNPVDYYFATALSGSKPLTWFVGANWSEETLRTRGELSEPMRAASVALIGGGAVGSAVAELLVRGGVRILHIFDGETIGAGNLMRHTLTVDDVGLSKAARLADRLNRAHLHAHVTAHDLTIQGRRALDVLAGTRLDLIIDCTGDDDLLASLSEPPPGSLRTVSVSMGLAARRAYLFFHARESIQLSDFHDRIRPWLDRDSTDSAGLELPMEGVGCWHPVFPARIDAVWAFSAASVARINSWMSGERPEGGLVVFERDATSGAVNETADTDDA